MTWLRRIWNALRPAQTSDRIAREIDFHLAERADDLRAEGLSDDEARRRARVRFGARTAQAEHVRDIEAARWVDALRRNVRQAARGLVRTPGFTLAVVLTLAVGIGANTAVFSAINAVLLQPLPFPEGDRLMRLSQLRDEGTETPIAPVRLDEWHRLNSTFDGITGYYVEDVAETSGDLPEQIRRAWVAPRFLEVWRMAPAMGRGFNDEDYVPGGQAVVLLSDRYWRTRFAADPGVAGRTLRIGTATYPIVGVMPPTFHFSDPRVDVWCAQGISARLAQVRNATWYGGIGRLAPGVTRAQALANLTAVQRQLGEQHPETDARIGVGLEPLKDTAIGDVRGSLWLLFGSVSVLLLIACTNIAALLLARATRRRQEIAVRLSLGASRATVAAQLLTEAGVLAIVGSALGLLVGAGGIAALRRAAIDLPRIDEIAIDGSVLAYTLVSVVAVTLLCGLLPALRSARGDAAGVVRDTSRTQVATRSTAQWVLVGTQVALSVTLLTGAVLLARSIQELSRVDPGFDPRGVLTFRVSGTWAETVDYPRLIQRVEDALEALRALPGVEHAATSGWSLPGTPVQYQETATFAEGRNDSDASMVVELRGVSRDYFATMRIPLLDGEACPVGVDPAALVNRSFVARYLPDRSPVGRHLVGIGDRPTQIVGVVGDAREQGLDRVPGPTVYSCASAPNPTPRFLVRTQGDPMALAQTVRATMKELEPLRSVYDVAPLEERIGDAYAQNRLRSMLLVAFAGAALALACIGLYGTLNYVVSLRRREAGLRLALGAMRRDIVRQFLMRGLRVAAVACACGLVLSVATTRAMSSLLYGVSPTDPATFAGVAALVLAAAALAAFIPSVRAARVEPMQVLRDD